MHTTLLLTAAPAQLLLAPETPNPDPRGPGYWDGTLSWEDRIKLPSPELDEFVPGFGPESEEESPF